MLILSTAKVTVKQPGEVSVEGKLARYATRISQFIDEIGLRHATIRLRFERYVFSRNIDPPTRQRLRNFLVNECPLG